MMNFSDKQNKNIWRPEIPDSWSSMTLRVYSEVNNPIIFQGEVINYGDVEIDVSDWIEQKWSEQKGEGAFVYGGDMLLTLQNNESPYEITSKSFSYKKDVVDLTSENKVDGLINATAPALYMDNRWRGVYVYPIFYFKVLDCDEGRFPELVNKDCMLDTSFTLQQFNIGNWNPTTNNLGVFYNWDDEPDPHPGDGVYEEQIMNCLKNYDEYIVLSNYLVNYATRFYTEEDEVIEFDWEGGKSIINSYVINDTLVIDERNSNFPIRMTKESMVKCFELFKSSIEESISGTIELIGCGYDVIYCYPDDTSIDSYLQITNYTYGDYFEDNEQTCPYMDLVCCNSDFRTETDDDIRIPLLVKNRILSGKTINKMTKITHMDRYGDTHNDSGSNKFELECFVDEDYITTHTGNDDDYTQLMMVLNTARYNYLVGNTKLSGIKTDGPVLLKCRVKDIEKTETYSKYSMSNVLPTLKITLEIYR